MGVGDRAAVQRGEEPTMSEFAPALAVADAVLYEGYLLYPYTKSALKNRVRWQFGVIVPSEYARTGTGETALQQTEVLLEVSDRASVAVLLRFLHVEARRVESWTGDVFTPVASLTLDGRTYLTFDEAAECELAAGCGVDGPVESIVPIALEASLDEELLRDASGALQGRILRERWALRGRLTARIETVADAPSLRKVRVLVENESDVVAGERAGALRTALVSTHVLLSAKNGRFVSLLDPTPEAAAATATLSNQHVFPVLVGGASADERHSDLVLSSPIILYDFPAVAPQTDADAFDATEIDELLTLSVLSLPDAERDEAKATDPRARAIVERAERYGAAEFARLHAGTLHARPDVFAAADPFAAIDVPALDCVFVGGAKVTKGSTVRLHPKRRADVWDIFLDGKAATVRAIHQDLEDQLYIAVTVDEDPASDLHDWYGRSFFFYPEEIEPLRAGP